MGTHTSAELDVFDCKLGEGGLEEFEPEAERAGAWPRVATPSPADLRRWQPFVAPSPARERTWLFAVPIVVGAALLGAAVSLVAVRPAPVTRHVPAQPTAASPAPPAPPVVVPVAPAVAAPTAIALPAAAAAPKRQAAALDATLEPTLAAVSRAYRALDPASLTAVWPGADTAGLSQSFSDLKYQALTFDRCRVQPNGSDAAVATCEVSIASASKDGDSALQRRRESWTLALGRDGDRWTIAGVTVR